MTSIFRRLIMNEFGTSKYRQYYSFMQEEISEKNDMNEPPLSRVYSDMADILEKKELSGIVKMHDRLNEAFIIAIRINKSYIIAMLAYLTALLIIIASGLVFPVMVTALVVITSGFIYKTCEFVLNKFCYIDMRIVLEYKRVLEKLLLRSVGYGRKDAEGV